MVDRVVLIGPDIRDLLVQEPILLQNVSMLLGFKSLMAEWLEEASQWHDMYCHDLEAISSNPCQVELGVHSTSLLSRTWTKHKQKNIYLYKSAEIISLPVGTNN